MIMITLHGPGPVKLGGSTVGFVMHLNHYRWVLLILLSSILAACAPPPVFKATGNEASVPPSTVAQTPEHFIGRSVIWGGRVISVQNLSNSTRIKILGYPLDSSQRPQLQGSEGGRFIAIMRGYVERLNYPPGTLVTIRGHIKGTFAGHVGQAAYVFPLVQVDASHVWTAEEMRSRRPNVNIGIGLGYWHG